MITLNDLTLICDEDICNISDSFQVDLDNPDDIDWVLTNMGDSPVSSIRLVGNALSLRIVGDWREAYSEYAKNLERGSKIDDAYDYRQAIGEIRY